MTIVSPLAVIGKDLSAAPVIDPIQLSVAVGGVGASTDNSSVRSARSARFGTGTVTSSIVIF